MGIKHLWTILGPFNDRKPLSELQGKTVAVDLSGWVCEAQNIAEYQVQPRMYLRNLYFRTCFLLLMEVYPVFVLEGEAPKLKYDTIAARNAIQFKGAKPKSDSTKKGKDRSRFNHTLKLCEEMLKWMGLKCVKGSGEAEAFCAYLNEDGLVAGCISQDSDCFAYGAQVVYRNFSISQQGIAASSGGAVDVYDIKKIQSKLDFGRNKIVVLALLCGSDYNEGVFGVGKDSVEKLFSQVPENEIMQRIYDWKNKETFYKNLEEKLLDKNVCSSCGHFGKVQSHSKKGCLTCRTDKGCKNDYKEEKALIKNEVAMRNRALEDAGFPCQELIEEFTVRKDNVNYLDIKWKKPDLINFVKFTVKYLGWEELYSVQKLLPILCRWQVLNYSKITDSTSGTLTPDFIKKIRKPKDVLSYEIIWADKNDYFKNLIPEEQLATIEPIKLWSSIEPQTLVEKAYPELVEKFHLSKIKPKKTKKANSEDIIRKPRKKRINKELKQQNLEESFGKLVIKPKKPKNQRISTYLTKAPALASSTPQKSSDFDFTLSDFVEKEEDLSGIIDEMTSRTPECLRKALKSLNLKKVTQKHFEDEVLETSQHDFIEAIEDEPNINETIEFNYSSFFISNAVENDLFEKTFNELRESSGNTTEEYDFEAFEERKLEEDKMQDEDTFDDDYVPLIERLRGKAT